MNYSFDYLIEKYPEDIMDILEWREKILNNAVKACLFSMLFGLCLSALIFIIWLLVIK